MLRKLGFNSQLSQGIQKISPDEWRKKIDGANVQGSNSNAEPKTIDPLTGKLITASESKAKYGDGTKLIYVKIEGEVHQKEDGTQTKGMGKIERITVAEYQRRYKDYKEPPKAAESMQELLGIDTSTMKPADTTPKTIDPLTGKMITADEFKEKYGEGNQVLYVTIPDDNGIAQVETMTVKEYCHRYRNVIDPPKASLANAKEKEKDPSKKSITLEQYLKLYNKPIKLTYRDK